VGRITAQILVVGDYLANLSSYLLDIGICVPMSNCFNNIFPTLFHKVAWPEAVAELEFLVSLGKNLIVIFLETKYII
jgi:hypothetical protein